MNSNDIKENKTKEDLKKKDEERNKKLNDMEADMWEKVKKASNLAKNKFKIEKIYIVGSLAEGNIRENSDIDIAIEFKEDFDYSEFIDVFRFFEDALRPYNIDLIDMGEVNNKFLEIITEEGVKV